MKLIVSRASLAVFLVSAVVISWAQGTKIEARDKDGATSLIRAAENSDVVQIKAFLAEGANVNARNDARLTPLLAVISIPPMGADHSRVTDCVRALIANNAGVNVKDLGGWSPLHFAAHYGYADCVEALIAAHANVDQRSDQDVTPTMEAPMDGQIACLNALIAGHAKVNERTRNGVTALMCAVTMPLMAEAPKGITDCVRALLAAHANVNAKASGGRTALMVAIWLGRID